VDISSLPSLPSLPTLPSIGTGAPSLLPTPSTGDTTGGMFAHVLESMLGQAAAQQQTADQGVLDVAAGRTDSLHNVVLEVAKADIAFRLMLEIRNRLSDAYQEVMKMTI
jgi:flagellar hook-basal body complex protein FliE